MQGLTEENFTYQSFRWRDRQAGVSLVFDHTKQRYFYNAYCLEVKLLKELFSCEYEFLEDALHCVNEEFGNWELESFEAKKDCGSCAAKK